MSTPLMTLKMDVVAPIPRAIVTVTTDEKPRCLRKERNAKRRSLSSSFILDTIPDGMRMRDPPTAQRPWRGAVIGRTKYAATVV